MYVFLKKLIKAYVQSIFSNTFCIYEDIETQCVLSTLH